MIKRILPLVALSLVLSSCAYLGSSFKVDELNKAEVNGTPFHKELVSHYRARANDSENVTFNYDQAYDNAERGLLAADGQDVAPLDPNDFDIPPELRPDIDEARIDLTNLLSQQARDNAPQEAALAQTKFDCWVEDAAKNSWAPEMFKTCKADFAKAAGQLKAMLGAPPEIKEIAQQGPGCSAKSPGVWSPGSGQFLYFLWQKPNFTNYGKSFTGCDCRNGKAK